MMTSPVGNATPPMACYQPPEPACDNTNASCSQFVCAGVMEGESVLPAVQPNGTKASASPAANPGTQGPATDLQTEFNSSNIWSLSNIPKNAERNIRAMAKHPDETAKCLLEAGAVVLMGKATLSLKPSNADPYIVGFLAGADFGLCTQHIGERDEEATAQSK